MEPNSVLLVVVLFGAGAGCVVLAIRYRLLAVRIACGILALALSAAGGMALVNDYYGYYQTWSQLSADLSGSYAAFAPANSPGRTDGGVQSGALRSVTLRGAASGITRRGLVYLPPQYFQPAYRHTRFPVVELLHGSPGAPSDWLVHLQITKLLDRLISSHAMGPVIAVMPSSNDGNHWEECLNAPGRADDTYISRDVPADVMRMFRATRERAEWGLAGYSSGGYCTVNLALRHRADYGAAAAMDAYVRPTDGPAAGVLHHDPAAEAANDPLRIAQRLRLGAHPLPAFWLAAGTADHADLAAALALEAALRGVEQVTVYREPGAAHNFYAWRPAVPLMLAWMWQQLAPPDLRVDFPVAGAPHSYRLQAPGAGPRQRRGVSRACRPADRATHRHRPPCAARV